MFTIPAPIMKAAGKAGNWLVKNAPTIMSVGGGMMAVGGAVMACEATLHADEVLDRHAQKMAKIRAARAQSDEANDALNVYTHKDEQQDKFVAYATTAIEFAKLYGPAFSVGMSGIGLMQAAFWITEYRRASAIAALTGVNEMYQALMARTEEFDIPLEQNPAPRLLEGDCSEDAQVDEDESTKLVFDPDKEADPFFFMFKPGNPNWCDSMARKHAEFCTNRGFLEGTLTSMKLRLSTYARPQLWYNEILKTVGEDEVDYGYAYGINGLKDDVLTWEIIPFLIDEYGQYVETDDDTLKELESQDIQANYAIGVRIGCSSKESMQFAAEAREKFARETGKVLPLEAFADITRPRFIYNEVYGK